MLLTPQEREQFTAYAKQEAGTNAILAEQLRKMGDNLPLAKNMAVKAMAWQVVADDLSRPVENVTVSEGES